MAIKPVKSARMRVKIINVVQEREHDRRLDGTTKPIDIKLIIAIGEDDRGTVIRMMGSKDDMIIAETMAEMAQNSDGGLIILSPIGFDDEAGAVDHSRRGDKIAVNPDFIAFKAAKKWGSVIYIDNVSRGILVRETPRKIETLMNGI